jgi:glycosyltransferase involved in cell wall biosynthesis
VVSTPYLHAKEALGEGRGVFCNFNDSASIAKRVSEIIENKSLRKSLEYKAYRYSRKFTWPLVAKKYLALFDKLTRQSREEWLSSCHL